MKYIIKRTTVSLGQENTYFFMRLTPMGPMFQPRNLACCFGTYDDAEKFFSENLSNLDGTFEIIAADEY